jgi:protein-S-isoprenylcysteine O-methyltransferase Ste14
MDRAIAKRRQRDWWALLSTVGLATLLVTFAWVHFSQWRITGQPVGLGLMVQETLTAVLFVVRRRPRGTSRSWLAWLATGIGSFGMLAAPLGIGLTGAAYAPVGGLESLYVAMQLVGASAATLSLATLGRSFGLVAANRGVQTGGPYRLVRHPAYASYLITYVAYVLENPSIFNAGIFVVATAFQVVRIAKEEEFLSADPAYVAYRERVRYRLVPYLY